MVKDINQTIHNVSSDPQHLIALGDTLIFSADTVTRGRGLWRSDGTAEGTVPLRFFPYGFHAPEKRFSLMGNAVFFFAYSAAAVIDLWRTDGTEVGTRLVKSFPLHVNASGFRVNGPQQLTHAHGLLYFLAADPAHGFEIWRSDGTPEGTVMLKDIFPGAEPSYEVPKAQITAMGGSVYFTKSDGIRGMMLWRTDGTEAGTMVVREIRPGTSGDVIEELTVMGESMYFKGYDPSAGHELWRSDGTEAGTAMLVDLYPGGSGSSPAQFTAAGNTLYFQAFLPSSGLSLCKSDGTAAGTVGIKAVATGSIPPPLTNLKARDGGIYFSANDTGDLWKSDGSGNGTVMVSRVYTGSIGYAPSYSSFPAEMVWFQGLTYFRGYGRETNSTVNSAGELWRTDGTSAGTEMLKDIFPGTNTSAPMWLTEVGGKLYFNADDGIHGRELWRTDGTSQGTLIVKDLAYGDGSYPAIMHDVNGTLCFMADDGINGRELWRSDGSANGTYLLKDIDSRPTSSGATSFVFAANSLFFRASDATHGYEVWKTDGTAAGTVLVKDIVPGSQGSFPTDLFAAGNTVFFSANDSLTGSELWKSDGTAAGTMLVKDINVGTGSASPGPFTAQGNAVFFRANTGTGTYGLWRSDGTTNGTVKVSEVYPDSSFIHAAGNNLFFAPDFVQADPNSGLDLWVSDGLSNTHRLVPELAADRALAIGNLLYFLARPLSPVDSDFSLWRSDGTAVGTGMLKDFVGGHNFTPASWDASFEGSLLALKKNSPMDIELWRTNGTETGTRLIKGFGSVTPWDFVVNGNEFYFRVREAPRGGALWRSDGTAEGTFILTQFPESLSYTYATSYENEYNAQLTLSGNQLYLVAGTETQGYELYAMTLPNALETWRARYFQTLENVGLAADEADSDGDGIVNLLEFAFASNPIVAGPSPLPQGHLEGADFVMKFQAPVGRELLQYGAEWTDDLATAWTVLADSGTAGGHEFHVSTSGKTKCFLRLRVRGL